MNTRPFFCLIRRTNFTLIPFSLLVCAILAGCSGIGSPRQNPATVADSDFAEGEQSAPQWIPSSPIETLDEALTTANPFVYTNTAIPHELAIRILELCNQEQNWESFDATQRNARPMAMRPDTFARYSLALLEGFRQQRRYEEIANWLDSRIFLQKFPLMASEYQVALSFSRADQLARSGELIDSAKERLFVHDFVSEEQRSDNFQHIWQNLLASDNNELVAAQGKRRYRELQPWISLALIIRDFRQPAPQQAKALADWRNKWPKHPANQFAPAQKGFTNRFASTLFGSGTGNLFDSVFRSTTHQRTGVFLPLSGKLASAGKAVRDGILTAHFNSLTRAIESDTSIGHQQSPSITFYDTHQADMASLYARARGEGVSIIIGPLQKQHVQTLFTMPTEIPIVTLNYVDEDLPPTNNIIQFGLAAEDEARQLASQALDNGYQQPLLLVSQKNWSNRAARAFNETWLASGGAAPVIQIMTERSRFSDEVADSLKLPQSNQRHRELENATAQQLSFTPRRRQDVDVIILLTNDQDARAINPLLAYHYASDLPVMASSYVHGAQKTAGYTDLDGIIFSELPWLLPNTDAGKKINAKERARLISKTQKRLYAMGQDAFHLAPRLGQLVASPHAQWAANTGRLSIRNNRVVRETPLAQFRRGRVIAFDSQLQNRKRTD